MIIICSVFYNSLPLKTIQYTQFNFSCFSKANHKRQKYEKIYESKLITTTDVLCKGFPREIHKYIAYCRQLKFEENPDYDMLRDDFRNLFRTLTFVWDYVFDWVLLKQRTAIHKLNAE